MGVQMVIDLPGVQSSEMIIRALDIYKLRLRASIERTQRRLNDFERRFGMTARAIGRLCRKDTTNIFPTKPMLPQYRPWWPCWMRF